MTTDYHNSRDVDRRWAWVVLGATMVGQIITGTIVVSVWIFQTEFLANFTGSSSYISLISSIHISLELIMGPVAGMMCNIFGIRATMMIGAVFLSVGLFVSSFATNLHHLLGLYSIVAGVGFGITYTPNNVIIGHYFHKRRGLASGLSIAACGIGIGPGTSLMVWITETQGWRFSLSVLACIALQKAVIGSMFYPLENLSARVDCCRKESSEVQRNEDHPGKRQSCLWFVGNSHWWILCVNYGISMVGFAIHLVHFPSYALARGVSSMELSKLISTFGVVMSLSRILGGFFCNDSSVDLLTVMFATQGLYGVFMVFMPLYASTYSGLMVYQVTVSLFFGTSMVPLTPFVVQLFGVDKLATVFGWIMMWEGLGYLTGPVIAGVLYDLTGSFSTGFYVGGSAITVSTFLLLLIPLTKNTVTQPDDLNKLQKLLHEDQTASIEVSVNINQTNV